MSSSPSRHRPVRLGARAVAGVAIAAALLLAGCGGDSGGSPSAPTATARAQTATTPVAMTHEELVAAADALCAKATTAIAKIPAARSLSGLADYAASVQAVGNTLHDELSALRPASAERDALATYLDGIATANQALDEMRSAAQDGDAEGVRAAARTIDETAVGVLATRAGLPGCAATVTDGTGS